MSKNKNSSPLGSIYLGLAARLLLVLFLFSLCRILFYAFNAELYPDMTFPHFLKLMAYGFRFDLTALLYVNGLYLVFYILPFKFRYKRIPQIVSNWVFYITNSLALLANCIDFIYFRFTLRRTTWSVFQEFAHDKGNTGLMGRFIIDFWYVALVWIALVVLLVFLYKRVRIGKPLITKNWKFYLVHGLLFPVLFYFSIIGMRGGFFSTRLRPLWISDATEYTNSSVEAGIVLNTPLSICQTFSKEAYKKLDYFKSQKELDNIYSPIHKPLSDTAKFTPKNVVILVLESFSMEYVGAYNKSIPGYKSYTPFLDSLITQSTIFEYSFANGRKTVDQMPSIFASIPSMEEPYVFSIYVNNEITTLPLLLRGKSYTTSFFHGATNGSMGMESFSKTVGFERYYGKTQYNNDADFDGFWGIWDEPFLQFFADKLNTQKQPFLSAVMTVTSHHPFVVPAKYKGKFPKGTMPIHQCIGYTDHALQMFFEKVSKMPWYENTLFVISADHATQGSLPQYRTDAGNFKIPIIFFDPSNPAMKGVIRPQTVQQIDIMPTVLNYLHFDKPYFSFGMDAFAEDPNNKKFAFSYLNGFFMLYQGNYVLETNEEGIKSLYDMKADPLLKKNLKTEMPDKAQEMNAKFKAFLQQYNNHMIDNTMVVK